MGVTSGAGTAYTSGARWWFSPGIPVSSTNKTDCHDRAEILLKVALITIKQIQKPNHCYLCNS
jgi:hypothetical protein